MDLNPYRFTAEWTAYEFCTHALGARSELLLLSMAWLTNAPPPPPPPPDPLARHDEASTTAAAAAAAARAEPDMETLRYWFARMEPLILAETERVVALANRCGDEPPAARYAGTSWIGRVGKGRIGIWGLMGRGEEGVLEVDTEGKPKWVWEMRRRRRDDDDDDDGNGDD